MRGRLFWAAAGLGASAALVGTIFLLAANPLAFWLTYTVLLLVEVIGAGFYLVTHRPNFPRAARLNPRSVSLCFFRPRRPS